MSLKEKLLDLEGAIGGLGTYAPDEYPEWSYRNYEYEKVDILQLWAEIRPLLTRDLALAELVDVKIREGLAAFEHGEKGKGRKAMWEIYNLGIRELR